MRRKSIVKILCVMAASILLTGCGGPSKPDADQPTDSGEIKEFTFFSPFVGTEIDADNDIQKIITEKIGARCTQTYLTGQTLAEAVGMMIASGEYPDFIVGDTSTPQLIEAGALVPFDEYWDDYPVIKNFWADWQYEYMKAEDGHIYSIPQGNINGKFIETGVAEAFFIQTRVLKWAGYPQIDTLDELFDLLEAYYAEHPTMEDGASVIPFGITCCQDCNYLVNPPLYLDGTMNEGSAIVDEKTYQVIDHRTTDTARRYFEKLNEEYKKGIIDPEFMTMSKDQFMEKIASGRVLCMVNASWQFSNAEKSIIAQGLTDCTYVPLGITMEKDTHDKYAVQNVTPILTGGLSITKSCKDIPGAMKFLCDLMSQEISTLRNWGVEGVDYLVDENGLFYRTDEMRANAGDPNYAASHFCPYSGFFDYVGMNLDNINAAWPSQQPSEWAAGLLPEQKEVLEAYGCTTFVNMVDTNEPISIMDYPWYPLWGFTNTMSTETPGGLARVKIADIESGTMPKLVIADDFDRAWEDFLAEYSACRPEDYIGEMQEEVYNRIEKMTGKNVRPDR